MKVSDLWHNVEPGRRGEPLNDSFVAAEAVSG
jgi:hypothetical protein